jgi:hypothetical protein
MIVRILNPNNLPQALVNAASPEEGHTYDKDRYSITDLIGSPWQRHLKMKHSGEVEVDVEDMTWLLMGKAFHLLMEKHSPKDAVAEHKIVINYKDVTLVGIPDLYHNGTLYDFKVTSVWSMMLNKRGFYKCKKCGKIYEV